MTLADIIRSMDDASLAGYLYGIMMIASQVTADVIREAYPDIDLTMAYVTIIGVVEIMHLLKREYNLNDFQPRT